MHTFVLLSSFFGIAATFHFLGWKTSKNNRNLVVKMSKKTYNMVGKRIFGGGTC